MLHRVGFVASVLSESLSTSRTCRVRNATESRLRELIEQNLAALDQVVSFLERQRIGLYRISSGLIPLASHPVNTVRWWKLYHNELAAIGARFRQGRIRVSMHPGQYTVINSPNPAVVAASVAELAFHARLLDLLGTGPASKIVLHIGGQYGQAKEQAVERFTLIAEQLPDAVRRRLVVENDDRLFNAEHALEVSRRIGVPVVFDYLHHKANPAMRPVEGVVKAIFSTWGSEDGLPKIHLSTQADNARLEPMRTS